MEMFLVKNGFTDEYVEILTEKGKKLENEKDDPGLEDEIAQILRRDKTGYSTALIEKLRNSGLDESRVPEFFATSINDLIARVR